MIGRIPPALSLEQAERSFDADARRALASMPGAEDALGTNWTGRMRRLDEQLGDRRLVTAALLLLGGVLLVLALASANVAALHLLRTLERSREMAVRQALGGTAARVKAMLVVEVSFLVAAGAAGGLLLRSWIISAVGALTPEPSGTFGLRSAELLTASAFGLNPNHAAAFAAVAALAAVAIAVPSVLAVGNPRNPSSLRAGRLPGGIVAFEIALTVVVLGAASLMAASARHLWQQDRGFQPHGVLTVPLETPQRTEEGALRAFHGQLLERITALPGVETASVASCVPGTGRCRRTNVARIDGVPVAEGSGATVGVYFVGGDHFAVLETPLLRGRHFLPHDERGPPVAIVNEAAARRLWPGADPVGRTVSLHFASGLHTEDRQVVGVVRDVQFNPVEPEPLPDVYLPESQAVWGSTTLFIRSTQDGMVGREMLERVLAAVDPDAAIRDVQPLEAHIGRGFSTERMLSTLLVAFGTTALALTTLGLYGLVSSAVSSGQRELALRIALGATPARITLLLVGRLNWILAAGFLGGIAGALATGRTLSAFLFGVTPADPAILTLACGLLLLSAILAAAAPLSRAVLTNPATLMRE